MMRVWISEKLRTRIRVQAVRMKITMGDLIEEIMEGDKSLEELEKEWAAENQNQK